MRRHRLLTTTLATVIAAAVAAPAAGQIEPLDRGEAAATDLSAFILPIEATIVSLDDGVSTSESTEEVTIALEADVFFAFDEAELLPEARDVLDEVATDLDAHITEVSIAGHTDNVGSDDYNQTLSEERAEAVERHLAGQLDDVSFEVEGFGASEPVAPNETEDGEDDEEGRALNRRVEIRYTP